MSTKTTSNKVKKQSGSPAPHQSRSAANKPKRVPVSGNRDILTVLGTDPDFVYRWVKDKSEAGQRIFRFRQAAYEFVDGTIAALGVGDNFVYETHDLGSLIRKPSGDGEFLYLMRISKEFYDEDQTVKQIDIKEREDNITRVRDPHSSEDDGQYGSISIS